MVPTMVQYLVYANLILGNIQLPAEGLPGLLVTSCIIVVYLYSAYNFTNKNIICQHVNISTGRC